MRFLVLFFIFISWKTVAQQKAPVKFYIDNENGYFEILADDTLLIKRYRDSLTVGIHKLQIWSYGYDVSNIEVDVKPDTLNEVHVKLYRSEAYNAFAQSYDSYRMKFHKNVTLPISGTLLMGIGAGAFMLNAYDLKKKVEIDIENYYLSSDVDEIADIKVRIDENNRKYNINRFGYYITGSLFVAGTIASVYTSIHFKKNNTEPTLNKQSPFALKTSFYFTGNGFSFYYQL